MERLVGKAEAERLVLNFLLKSASSTTKFNPYKLTIQGISKGTGLSTEDVEEALETLSRGSARVEKVVMDFEFWLPLDIRAERVKKYLFAHQLAVENIYLYAFIAIIILSYFLNKVLVWRWINLKSNWDFFVVGIIIAFISIKIGKYIFHKHFLLSERLSRIRGYQYYVWGIIIFTGLCIWWYNSFSAQQDSWQKIGFLVSLISGSLTIVSFVIQYFIMEIKKRK